MTHLVCNNSYVHPSKRHSTIAVSLKKITALLFFPVLALSLTPYLGAQTTLDQQKRTARVYANGSLETPTPWISSVAHTSGTGRYDVIFATPFTAPPNCVVTVDEVIGTYSFAGILNNAANTPQSLNSVTVNTYTPALLGGIGMRDAEFGFRISCIPDQTVATSSATWDQNANLVYNPNTWISSVSNTLGTGLYTVTFAKPYLTAPTCVATPSLGGNGNPPSSGSTLEIQVFPTYAFITTQYFATTGLLGGQVNILTNLTCTGPQ